MDLFPRSDIFMFFVWWVSYPCVLKALIYKGFQLSQSFTLDINVTHSTCIVATYGHGLDNKGMRTGVLEARAVFTPGRDKARNPTCRRFKEDGEPSYTLTGQDRHGVMLSDGKHYAIRRLTPRECFRLQGFPDDLYEKAAGVCSESQLYKQAGNAVTITVAEAVARELLRAEEEWK